MKIYIVTSLIEGQDEGAEVNVIGTTKTLNEAKELMQEVLNEAKEMYEENEIDYNVEQVNEKTTIIQTISSYEDDEEDYEYDGLERIEYNIFESEVE